MPAGRPSTYTEELGDRICDLVASSTMSTRKICDAHDDLPTESTVYAWIFRQPEFSKKYWHAKDAQADLFALESLDIVDDVIEDANAIRKAELRIKQRNWHAARLRPNRWAERDKEDKATKSSAIESLNLETE